MEIPSPAYIQNNIPIIFSVDENYAPYLSVCIKSLIENSSINNNYDIWILNGGLSQNGEKILLNLIRNYSNISIRFFNIKNIREITDFNFFVSNHASLANYFRLFIPKIFYNYKKIIYLDCDLIINKDIADLFYIDLEGKICGAVIDACTFFNPNYWARYCLEKVKIINPTSYFNSGVLVCDINKMIEKSVTERSLQKLAEFNPVCWDQCILNSVLENEIKYLDMRWNFQWHWLLPEFLSLYPINQVEKKFLKQYLKANETPFILHYTSHVKPWNRWKANNAKLWWEYARKTENYSSILEKSCRIKTICDDDTCSREKLDKNDEIKISIIVPVYNVSKYLSKCLDSLINQTLKEIEIICIDDGSADGSKEILEKYSNKDARIIYIEQKNSGQGSARNRGLEIARGKYIQFIDSDDSYCPDCCSIMYKVMEEECVDIACFEPNIIYEAFLNLKDSDSQYFALKYSGLNDVTPEMCSKLDVNCWNKIFRKSFLNRYNIKFPENTHYEDVAFFWLWITRAKKIFGLKKRLINYVRRKNSFVGNLINQKSKYMLDGIRVNNLIYDYLKENNLLNKFGQAYLKYIINRLPWQISCINTIDINERRQLIDATSELISNFDIKDFKLNKNEELLFYIIKEKRYYALNSGSNIDNKTISPFFDKNNIPIVFAVDSNYVQYLSVAIQSIIENRSHNCNYDIVILYTKLQDYEKQMLLSIQENISNVAIRFINMDFWIKEYNLSSLLQINHITLSAYFRLLVSSIFENYDKIIYLDSDIIVEKDIQELYNIDIGSNSIAAVLDTVIAYDLDYGLLNMGLKTYLSKFLNIKDTNKYFNSGVLLINIKKWKELEIENKLLQVARINNKFFHDQNVLNSVFQEDYYELPQQWNFQYHVKFQWLEYHKKLPEELIKLYDDISIKPFLIHYTSVQKPWIQLNHSYVANWWKYARKSPFYEQLIYDLHNGQIQGVKCAMNDKERNMFRLFHLLNNKHKIKANYYRSKILSFLTIGSTRKHYKNKKELLKHKVREIRTYEKIY